MMQDNFVLNGLFGLCVGDALGLPVQFASRIERKSNPVAEMTGYGVFNMPPGTWSDDSSLTFCLAESLCRGYDINDIAEKFIKWIDEGYWTPFDQAFDIGGSTSRAISRLKNGVSPHQSGDKGEINNGNGSLMRILPLAFYLRDADLGLQFEIAHEVSAITHAHTRSLIACGVYITIALELIRGCTLNTAYETMKKTVLQYYVHEPFISELKLFNRLLHDDISRYRKDEIQSSGYVVHTIEASLWCLFNHQTYADTVLTAVNLGEDTDTTAAVAGGLAGLIYGYDAIPEEWINLIQKREKIVDLSKRLFDRVMKKC